MDKGDIMNLNKNQSEFVYDLSGVTIFQSCRVGGKTTIGMLRLASLYNKGFIKDCTIIVRNINDLKTVTDLSFKILPKDMKRTIITVDTDALWIDELPSQYNQITFTPTTSYRYIHNPASKKIRKLFNNMYCA